jgi:hypothetical protein
MTIFSARRGRNRVDQHAVPWVVILVQLPMEARGCADGIGNDLVGATGSAIIEVSGIGQRGIEDPVPRVRIAVEVVHLLAIARQVQAVVCSLLGAR